MRIGARPADDRLAGLLRELRLDLAAHLVAREARADAAIGLIVPALSGHLQKVMDQYKTKGYDHLVGMLRTGPPWMHRTGPLATVYCCDNGR